MLINVRRPAMFCWRLAVIWTSLVITGSASNYSALHDDLFAKYRPEVHPRSNVTQLKVEVYVQFELRQLKELNEKREVLHTVGYITARWYDDFLKWDPENYGGVRGTIVPANKVWTPDFGIENSAEKVHEDTYFKHFRVTILSNGKVVWIFGGVLHTSCNLDITYYPFDNQTCEIRLKNWMYTKAVVELHNHSSEILLNSYQTNGLWELTGTRVETYDVFYDHSPTTPLNAIRFVLMLHRKPRYYVVNIIVPCMFITTIALLVYLLPPEAPGKVPLGVTILLAFSVFLSVITGNTPVTSDATPILGIFVTVSMGMSALTVITTVIVLYLHHHDTVTRPPAWLRVIAFRVLGRILCVRVPALSASEEDRSEQDLHLSNRSSSPPITQDDRKGECRTGNTTKNREQNAVVEEGCSKSPERSYDEDANAQLNPVTSLVSAMKAKQSAKDAQAKISEEWKAVARVVDRLLFTITLTVVLAIVTWFLIVALRHINRQ